MSKKTIKPFPGNPRKITPERLRDLGESLNEYGSLDGFVVNVGPGKYENCIISGNQKNKHINLSKAKITIVERYETPTETGTVAIGHVTYNGELFPYREVIWPDRKCEIGNIRANNLGGRNDVDLLQQFEADILEAGGIDMDFEMFVDTFMVGDGEGGVPNNALNSEAQEDDFEPPAEIEEIQTDIVLGDLFEIGPHRLLCGDSTVKEDVDRLMDGDGADMVFIDPPYGVSYASKNEYLNTISPGNRIQVPIENDHMSLSDTSDFILLLFKQLKRILKKRSSYYITAPQGGDLMMMMMMMMREAGIPLRHCLVWAKNNHVLGRCDYMYKHEPILYGWVDVHDFYGEGSQKFSVWNFDKPLKNDLHPTMKPVPLVGNALLNSTIVGNIVADLCLGSGTTMVAADQLNRRCFGMEISPKYCQVILDRMLKLRPGIEIKKNGQPYEPNTPT